MTQRIGSERQGWCGIWKPTTQFIISTDWNRKNVIISANLRNIIQHLFLIKLPENWKQRGTFMIWKRACRGIACSQRSRMMLKAECFYFMIQAEQGVCIYHFYSVFYWKLLPGRLGTTGNKSYPGWKGRIETVFVHRWHDGPCRKSDGFYKTLGKT